MMGIIMEAKVAQNECRENLGATNSRKMEQQMR